ncbi:MAG: cytochrome b N-terminal domain-containing protein [Acidimicrobiales bacterium]
MNSVLYHLTEGEAPRREGELRCARRTVVLPVHPAHGHGHLLDVLHRPAAQAWNDIYALQTSVTFGLRCATCTDGRRTSWCCRCSCTWRVSPRRLQAPAEFNWVIGVVLLLLTLLLSFTGYLLPWDQLALWAVTVGTNMMGYTPVFGNQVRFVLLGGSEIGTDTLLRWYVLHVLMLPFVIVIFMAIHFWRVRKDGGISGPL